LVGGVKAKFQAIVHRWRAVVIEGDDEVRSRSGSGYCYGGLSPSRETNADEPSCASNRYEQNQQSPGWLTDQLVDKLVFAGFHLTSPGQSWILKKCSMPSAAIGLQICLGYSYLIR